MPAIYLFHRRTLLGGDDLQFPALVTVAVRCVQLLCLLGVCWWYILIEAGRSNGILNYILLGPPMNTGNSYNTNVSNTDDDGSNNKDDYKTQQYSYSSSNTCRHTHLFPLLVFSYSVMCSIFFAISIYIESRIYHWTNVGSPTRNTQERTKNVQSLLELKLLPFSIIMALLCLLGVSALCYVPSYYSCRDAEPYEESFWGTLIPRGHVLWVFCLIVLALSQATDAIVSLMYVIHLWFWRPYEMKLLPQQQRQHQDDQQQMVSINNTDNDHNHHCLAAYHHHHDTRGYTNNNSSHSNGHHNHELVEEMWANRCNYFCRCLSFSTCFLFGGRDLLNIGGTVDTKFGDVARALADYLETRGILDVVPSDIVMGFLVLQHIQKKRILEKRKAVKSQYERILLSSEYNTPSVTTNTKTTKKTINESTVINAESAILASATSPPPTNVINNTAAAIAIATATATTTATSPIIPSTQQKQQTLDLITDETNNDNDLLTNGASPNGINHTIANGSPFLKKNSPSSKGLIVENGYQPISPAPLRISPRTLPSRLSPSQSSPTPSSSPKGLVVDEENGVKQEDSFTVLNPNNKDDIFLLDEGAHFSRYALAIYTWVLYLYVHPITGIPRILMACSTCTKLKRTCKGCFPCFRPNNNKRILHGHNHENCNNPSETRSPKQPSLQQHHCDEGQPQDVDSLRHDNNDNTEEYSDNNNDYFDDEHDNHDSDEFDTCLSDHRVIGDNICEVHKNALLLTASLEEDTDLIYCQLKSSFDENPYCILLDHKWKSVVVAIRGTFSLEDCVTDVLMVPESLESLGEEFNFDAIDQHCHGGVLICVRNVYRDLQDHKLLEKLLLDPRSKYGDYTLRLVGHSLGAATSTILSYMLKQTYPTLRCINYSPPGGTLTWDMATRCNEWCSSFALDSDVVPRLSTETLWNLRDEMLELIGRVQVPKIQVARKLLVDASNNEHDHKNKGGSRFCCLRNCFNNTNDNDDISCNSNIDNDGLLVVDTTADNSSVRTDVIDEILCTSGESDDNNNNNKHINNNINISNDASNDNTEYHNQLRQFKMIQLQRKHSRGDIRFIKLYPPGKFIHVIKTDELESCLHTAAKCVTCFTTNVGFQYTPIYINNDSFNEIIVTPTMGTDHFPNRIRSELENVAKDYGLEIQ